MTDTLVSVSHPVYGTHEVTEEVARALDADGSNGWTRDVDAQIAALKARIAELEAEQAEAESKAAALGDQPKRGRTKGDTAEPTEVAEPTEPTEANASDTPKEG